MKDFRILREKYILTFSRDPGTRACWAKRPTRETERRTQRSWWQFPRGNFSRECSLCSTWPIATPCARKFLLHPIQCSALVSRFLAADSVAPVRPETSINPRISDVSIRTKLTNLNEHQSNANLASLNSLSTLVRLKSRGQERNFHKGFTSSCSSFNSWENGVELPSLMTTLPTEERKTKGVLKIALKILADKLHLRAFVYVFHGTSNVWPRRLKVASWFSCLCIASRYPVISVESQG